MKTAREIFADTANALRALPWSEEVLTKWPAPIANELAQLLRMLDEGTDVGGLLMQTRDLAEVLLKTLTLTLAADLASSAIDGPEGAPPHGVLLDKSLTLGGWLGAFRELSGRLSKDALTEPEASVLVGRRSPFIAALDAYVANRNDDIGHGAYRPDSIPLAKRVRAHLLGSSDNGRRGLVDAFAALSTSGLWNSCHFRLDEPTGPVFSGADTARSIRLGQHGHTHAPRPLYLVRGDESRPLAPFIAGRLCAECGERDAFLLEGPRSVSQSDYRVDFLDYANGHRLRLDVRKHDDQLAGLMARRTLDRALKDSKDKGEFTSGDVVRLLDDILFDRRFLSPQWLRDPLKTSIQQSERSFWVRAPGHVGKTLFVRGLHGEGLSLEQREEQQDILGDGELFTILPVFLKREYRFDLVQFKMNLEGVARSGRLDSRYDLTIELGHDTPDRLRQSFVRFAETCVEAAFGKPVLIAIDGLDELPDPGDGFSVLDILPNAADMPNGAHLLLTSRPLANCPQWLQMRASARPRLAKVFEAGIDAPGYVSLLREYIGKHSGVGPNDPDFERIAEALLKSSEGLFLFVSFICDQMRDAIAPADAPLSAS